MERLPLMPSDWTNAVATLGQDPLNTSDKAT